MHYNEDLAQPGLQKIFLIKKIRAVWEAESIPSVGRQRRPQAWFPDSTAGRLWDVGWGAVSGVGWGQSFAPWFILG